MGFHFTRAQAGTECDSVLEGLLLRKGKATEEKDDENKARYLAGAKRRAGVNLVKNPGPFLTPLWRTAG